MQGQRRTRHGRHLRFKRVLDNGPAALALDAGKAAGTVLVGTGQQHAKQARAVGIGGRLEKEID